MHIFNCKAKGGRIVPLSLNKVNLLSKLLREFEENGKTFQVKIELVEKNINGQQIQLYNAFVIKASEYFGVTFKEMESMLSSYFPRDEHGLKSIRKWTTKELNDFIDKSSSMLSIHGFIFE